MPHTREAALASLQTEFLFDADFARLLALNAAIEAPRMGDEGERFAVAAESSNELVRRALASSGEAARLLRDTLGNCAIPMRRK